MLLAGLTEQHPAVKTCHLSSDVPFWNNWEKVNVETR